MADEAKGYWWCPDCDCEVDDSRVTHEGAHDQCGFVVTWEPVPVREAPMAERDLWDILEVTEKVSAELQRVSDWLRGNAPGTAEFERNEQRYGALLVYLHYANATRDYLRTRIDPELERLKAEVARLRSIVAAFRGVVVRAPSDTEGARLWLGQAMEVMDASADMVTVSDHDRWEESRRALSPDEESR